MKLGGLFSGVGGFELAWTQLGHEVSWMCEWDAKARKVLEARFPGVPIYPDVRDLDPSEVEAVDVLTGGSPCQGFSVAGARTGLEHSESQLFRDYIRIMDGLAERGLQYAIWENVPGVLSIQNEDGERTFNHVVAALAGGTEPVRLSEDKRWNTGMAVGRGRAVAWRVLDSRYFGVAQRRRRLFACVAFGDSCEDRAGRTLLAKPEGVQRNSRPFVQAREAFARGASQSPGGSSGYRMTAFGEYEDDDSASTLKQRDYKDATDLIVAPAVMMHVRGGVDRDRHGKTAGKGPLLSYELAATLDTAQPWTLFEPKDGARNVDYGVRRLSPVECERLQSFPDGWTQPSGSDGARFRAMGNAVTVNVVRWILSRMVF